MKRFSQAVVASAPAWPSVRQGEARRLCQLAADIEAGLSVSERDDPQAAHLALLKAAILYDLAGLPGASASYVSKNGFDIRFREFFTRPVGSVWGNVADERGVHLSEAERASAVPSGVDIRGLLEESLGEIAHRAGLDLQRLEAPADVGRWLSAIADVASDFSFGVTGDDLLALKRLVELREENSSLNVVPSVSTLEVADIRRIQAPLELWPAQVEALRRGMLDKEIKSFGFAAPTGTGKTALTRLLIADALASSPGRKVLYVCPSRALVHQVWADLNKSLTGLSIKVFEAGGHLITHDALPVASDDADVLVFTPERADLLLRVNQEFLDQVCLTVVDEAHHIEQGSRGVLLEFYLWRLQKLTPSDARIVQLSAVTPNIGELADWLTTQRSESVMLDWRTSRLRVGLLERSRTGSAILKFGDGAPFTVLPDGGLPRDLREGLATLAHHLSQSGIVLVLCVSPGAAETVAKHVSSLRSTEQAIDDDVSERLDAWIERELYPESELRDCYRKRVVFHHAQMPPRVREGIEDAIRHRKVDVICATTTLAEGVNFPFSTVVVESLVGQSFQLSPRALWNIAGRAGRFGVDSEGHCILFRPESWASKLVDFDLADYLRTALADIPPVRSALAHGFERLEALVTGGVLETGMLESISLSDIKIDGKATAEAKAIRAFINIMRVGYAHADSTGVISLEDEHATEFETELLASRQLSAEVRDFAIGISKQQRRVVRRATEDNPEFVRIAARVGWSLEAQLQLYKWLQTREDWQLERFGNIVLGGYIRDFSQLGYLVGPLAKFLIAFEGEALGGAIAFLAEKWVKGIPLSSFQQERDASFGRMISNVYGRMQYLLPWGLFGMHELLQYEAQRRTMLVSDGVSALSVLAAEGVPNFDALNLVLTLGIERVDATRLSERYARARASADVTTWFSSLSWHEVERTVKGQEQRRLDPTLRSLHTLLNQHSTS